MSQRTAACFIAASLSIGAGATTANPPPAGAMPVPAASRPAKPAAVRGPVIDINRATRAQLKGLPGIGDAEADRIVAGRPYLSKADLVSNKVLPAGVYLSIKNRVVALPDPKRSPTAQGKP